MRDLFAWRLRPSEDEFSKLWESATFVFDANYLLDLYRLSRRTTKDHIKVLEHLKNRIWLPYQVADEFFRNREEIIESEVASFQQALSDLEEWKVTQQRFNKLKGLLEKTRTIKAELSDFFNEDQYLDEQKNYLDAVDKLEQVFREKIKEIESAHFPLKVDEDIILEKILTLFESKVGQPFDKQALSSLYKEADDRYKRKIPPGFEDTKTKEDERQYGDFLLWREILDFAKKESQPIIFVTSEKKDDWWTKKNQKIVCPHIELRREFQEYVKQPFWIYRSELFLEIAKEKFKLEIDPKSIEETNAIVDVEFAEEDSESLAQASESLEQAIAEQIQRSGSALAALDQIAYFRKLDDQLRLKQFEVSAAPSDALAALDRIAESAKLQTDRFVKQARQIEESARLQTDRFAKQARQIEELARLQNNKLMEQARQVNGSVKPPRASNKSQGGEKPKSTSKKRSPSKERIEGEPDNQNE